MAETFLVLAKELGYRAVMFNLVRRPHCAHFGFRWGQPCAHVSD